MPITGLSSWLPTMQEFNSHWEAVNQQLGQSPLELPGGYTQTNFESAITGLDASMQGVTMMATASRVELEQLQMDKSALRERVTQFRLSVNLHLAGTRFAGRAPAAPPPNAIETKFMRPFDAMSELWAEINGASGLPNFTPPMLLPGTYQKTQFDLGRSNLRAKFAQYATSERELSNRRVNRDAVMKPSYERMKQYRTAVVLALPSGDPLLQNVPRLSPPPGSTPPGLVVSGVWDATSMHATFGWEPSTFKDIDKIQVRGCTGGTYKNGEEEVVQDLAATATSFTTTWGLTVPGALATFKFYVMATTTNENGGKAVKIVRPET